jgi:hypothetical protein
MPEPAAAQKLRASLCGELLLPGDDRYELRASGSTT